VGYLSTSQFVVYTYAAVTLERILLLKRDGVQVFNKTDLAPLLQDLLASLFGLIERDTTPEKLAENDFLMRCISLLCRIDERFNAGYDCESGHLDALSSSFYTASYQHSQRDQ
jgi:exportin-2 (importin alpha re-exporter)